MTLTKEQLKKIEEIVANFHKGKPNFSQLSSLYNVSRSTIRGYYEKFEKKVPFEEFRGRGRPLKISKAKNAWIGQRLAAKTHATTTSLAQMYSDKFGEEISDTTMRRRLQKLGYLSVVPVKKPLLTKAHIAKRYSFAKMHKAYDWKNVVFSDESTFQVGGSTRRRWVKKGTTAIVQTTKYPAKLMVWAGISLNGKTELYFVDGTLNGPGYVQLLDRTYLPWIRSKNFRGAVLQQDNAPCHTCKVAKAFMASKNMQVLPWPPNSPDLNPIENLWAILKEKVAQRSPTTKVELKAILLEEWAKIPSELLTCLVHSMQKRINECLAAKGGHTSY